MDKKKLDEEEKAELEIKVKEEIEKHNKLLRNIFFGFLILLAAFLLIYLFIISAKNFEYEGVEFTTERYCDSGPCLTLYKTSIPIRYQEGVTGNIINTDYNIWIRNDPKKLEKIPIKGEIIFRRNMVLSVNTENLFCDGDWVIAIPNLQKLDSLGINVMAKNESEIKIYLPAEDYMYVNIRESDETSLEQMSNNTYNMNVNNCEILKATERLMLEAFIQAHQE